MYWKQFTAEALPERAERFRSEHKTTYIVTTNDRADEINAEYVHELAARSDDTPIHAWAAWHTTQTAARAPHANAWGLRTYTGVCAGCRVMALVNLHQETAVVNGALGTVREVVFGQNSNKFVMFVSNNVMMMLVNK